MALMGVAGEVAAENAQVQGQGVGSMAALLLDELQLLPASEFLARIKLQA
jgi:hydroxyethylthiazole kinase